MPFSKRSRTTLVACLLAGASAIAAAQTRGATRTKFTPPVYPEDPAKKDPQGNVLLIGKIRPDGRVSDLHMVSASGQDFIRPAIDSVRTWEFEPALRNGKPVEIALNAGVRFRITGAGRGRIPLPILGDLAVFPADASGRKTGPDGFPLRKGKDAALRAEVDLDVPPREAPRTISVDVSALSPKGRKIPVFQPPIAVPALSTDVKFPVVIPVGDDWEDGVWILRFDVDGKSAGGGQFWLATDPETFRFVVPSL
jgi:TonB family protein